MKNDRSIAKKAIIKKYPKNRINKRKIPQNEVKKKHIIPIPQDFFLKNVYYAETA